MKLNNHLFIIGTLLSIVLISCKKDDDGGSPQPLLPITAFLMDKSTAETGETIIFTNESQNATVYTWNFGDGSPELKDENTTHAYSAEGTYTVTLTAEGAGGTGSATKSITVINPSPIADFTMDKTTAEAGEVITFSNASLNATTYTWNFGDGSPELQDENTTHTYSAEGTYTVTLTAEGASGIDSATKTVTITAPLPTASFIADKPTVEVGELVTFTNQSLNAASYMWDFDDGSATSAEEHTTHSFSAEGSYTVTLTVWGNNSSNSASTVITVTPASNPFLGKWNLISGKFNGANISALSGYREFGDEVIGGANWTGDSKCSMTQGSDHGYVSGAYEISGSTLIYGYNITIISWTNNTTNFSKFGVVGLGLQDVGFAIAGDILTITGVNNYGTTVLIYKKE